MKNVVLDVCKIKEIKQCSFFFDLTMSRTIVVHIMQNHRFNPIDLLYTCIKLI